MIVIRPILHWIGIPPVPIMATTTTIHYVFDMDKPPPKWSVDQYVTLLCKGLYDPCYDSRLDELSSCKVTKLELYKEKNGLYHEFVLAYIRHSFIDESGTEKIQTRVARLERIFKDAAASSFDLTSKPDTPAPAVDSIVIHETKEDACASRDAYCCYVVDFSEPKGKGSDNPIPSNDDDTHSNLPNILDLAIAAHSLNEIAENYSLFNTMRYWFANNLCRLLAQGRGYTVELRNKYRYKAGYFKQFPALASDGRITLCRSLSADALSPEARAKAVELGADSDNVIVPDSQEPPDASQFELKNATRYFSQSTTITNYYPKFIQYRSKIAQQLRDQSREWFRAMLAKEDAQREVPEKAQRDEKAQKELLEEREKMQKELLEEMEKMQKELLEEREESQRLRAVLAALQMHSAESKEVGGSSAAPSSLAAQ